MPVSTSPRSSSNTARRCAPASAAKQLSATTTSHAKTETIPTIESFTTDICFSGLADAWSGRFEATGGVWTEFDRKSIVPAHAIDPTAPLLWPDLPTEIHCHGVGGHDFSDFENLRLDEVECCFRGEGVRGVITIFLRQGSLKPFLNFMQNINMRRDRGELPHIAGVALEGPLLASAAGTPEIGNWVPNKAEWSQLAASGIRYTVLSPDMRDNDGPDISWIVRTLHEGGVCVALGHFRKDKPAASAAAIEQVLRTSEEAGSQSQPGGVMTDHLLNDMPRNFQHAWRSMPERRRRNDDLKVIDPGSWTVENMEQRLGVVPATLLRAARDQRLVICLNFDGEHVDLDICRAVVDLAGAGTIAAMTDRVDGRVMLGQKLRRRTHETLLRREDGVVAAGGQSINTQITNMRAIGLPEAAIWQMSSGVARRVLNIASRLDALGRPTACSYFNSAHTRHVFYPCSKGGQS